MYIRKYPLTPTQQATNGALDLFVDGFRKDNIRQMLVGLTVLSSATELQVHQAMHFVWSSQQVSEAAVMAMLAA